VLIIKVLKLLVQWHSSCYAPIMDAWLLLRVIIVSL